MRIECPSCHFSADITPEKLPQREANTKCPRCSAIFSVVPSEPLTVDNTRLQMICPKCGLEQTTAESCSKCGIIYEKYRDAKVQFNAQTFRVCKVCGAEGNYETNAATGDAVNCYNCDNEIPINDETKLNIESVNSLGFQTKNTGMPFLGVIFIISCLLPYFLLLMGYLIYGNDQSDKGWTFMLYLFVAGGLFLFNAFAGLPILMFVKFNTGFQKFSIAVMYIISAVTPAIFFIYQYLESAARRGH